MLCGIELLLKALLLPAGSGAHRGHRHGQREGAPGHVPHEHRGEQHGAGRPHRRGHTGVRLRHLGTLKEACKPSIDMQSANCMSQWTCQAGRHMSCALARQEHACTVNELFAACRYIHIGESHRGYLGTGSVDFGGLFRGLAKMGYAGPLTFESFSSAVVSPSLSNTLCVWRDLCAAPRSVFAAPCSSVLYCHVSTCLHATTVASRMDGRYLFVHAQGRTLAC